ncbi:MAG: efflux RND transporter periplasmic adaptor subunit [Endomicrobium sp.]|jgi:HlyD family secretion protein|uniref:efflux RND transporter periplasmic adaptor subunit n=1 Tax=Candidatus Endomicrobiellum cubanum TaxID=3242325 RepID=UPI00282C5A3B|nr:efflux RND transporter periplasmic adaptor subunit [Endomicrobium sp.]
MKRIIIILCILILILILLSVSLIFFRHQNFVYSGTVEAIEIDITPKITDNIIKFYVKEGDKVTKGQILAILDGKDILNSYNYAKTEFERASEIYKRNATSKENYDAKKYKYDDATIKKDWLTLKSPIDGKVLYKYYNEGEMAISGKKVLTLANLKEIDVWIYIPHNTITSININNKVTGYLPEINKNFTGYIYVINDEAEFTPKNVQTRSERERLVYGVKIRFNNDEKLTLKPGMTLEVKF